MKWTLCCVLVNEQAIAGYLPICHRNGDFHGTPYMAKPYNGITAGYLSTSGIHQIALSAADWIVIFDAASRDEPSLLWSTVTCINTMVSMSSTAHAAIQLLPPPALHVWLRPPVIRLQPNAVLTRYLSITSMAYRSSHNWCLLLYHRSIIMYCSCIL